MCIIFCLFIYLFIYRLGDRHGDNILLIDGTGGVMHVDFNYIFWAGERLHYPEIVPYRLTRNTVDAMGITGVEGNFRAVCEIVLSLFRQNAFVLTSYPFYFVVLCFSLLFYIYVSCIFLVMH